MRSSDRIPSSEITPERVYVNRRAFMRAGAAAVSLAATGVAYRWLNRAGSMPVETQALDGLSVAPATAEDMARGYRTDEPMTALERVGNYNNFYEFTTDKEGVAAAAAAALAARPRFGGGGGGGGGGGASGFRNLRISVRECSFPSSNSMNTS